MTFRTRRLRAAAVVAGLALATVGLVPAQAAQAYDDDCTIRQFGPIQYWYHSNFDGALSCQNGTVRDLSSPPTYFNKIDTARAHPRDGLGKQLWNDAGSAENHDMNCLATIWFKVGYQGDHVTLNRFGQPNWYSANLGPVNNNNRSQNWAC